MTAKAFNPLSARPRAKPETGRLYQSTESAPEPLPPQVFDTDTPAQSDKTPRRFDLGDLPKYGIELYPYLKKEFPHIHERTYPNWVRQCINDNTCHFVVCGEAAAISFMAYEPMDPTPFVLVRFILGKAADYPVLYADIMRWAQGLGVKEIRDFHSDGDDMKTLLPGAEVTKHIFASIKVG